MPSCWVTARHAALGSTQTDPLQQASAALAPFLRAPPFCASTLCRDAAVGLGVVFFMLGFYLWTSWRALKDHRQLLRALQVVGGSNAAALVPATCLPTDLRFL